MADFLVMLAASHRRPTRTTTRVYTFAGVLFGLVFPLAAIQLDYWFQDAAGVSESLQQRMVENPMLWILGAAPIFFGLFARIVGVQQERLRAVVDQQDEVIDQQTTDLNDASHKAQQADAAKSAFLATVSQEIRTPMNGVIGMADVLLDTELSPLQAKYVQTLRSSGESLLATLNDIVDSSKIEAGEMEIEHEPFDLTDCVMSGLEVMAAGAPTTDVELLYAPDTSLSRLVRGDAIRLRQVLMNLVGTVIAFTEVGEVAVSVSSRPAIMNGIVGHGRQRKVMVSVTDTGVGLSPREKSKLFRSYSEPGPSTTQFPNGMGLELALSRSLCELMGGGIEVMGDGQGHGLTFRFWVVVEDTSIALPDDGVEHDQLLRDRTVLIVDDNQTSRRVLEADVKSWGMLPRTFSSAEDALRELDLGASRIDIALIDREMPDIDGVQLARRIRSRFSQALSPFPLVLLSPGGVGDRDDSLFTAAVMKPVRSARLKSTVADLIASNSTRHSYGSTVDVAASDDSGMAGRAPVRILMAEDDSVHQHVAEAMFSSLGYEATIVDDGVEAVTAVAESEQPWDIIFMDIEMPNLDGLGATEEIRRLDLGYQPRIVALTANALQVDVDRCSAAGMDGFVAKPLRKETLAETLDNVRNEMEVEQKVPVNTGPRQENQRIKQR